jgi:uncharacterized membrane protein YgcG
LFEHQQGTLAFCRDELGAAKDLLGHALRLREWLADTDGAAVTRHNLQLLQLAPPPPQPLRDRAARTYRKTALTIGSALIGLTVLTLGVVKAATSSESHHRPPTTTAATTPASGGSSGTPNGPTQNGGGTGGGGTGGGGTGGGGTGGGGTGGGPLKSPVLQPADFGQVDITPGQAPGGIQVAVNNPNEVISANFM